MSGDEREYVDRLVAPDALASYLEGRLGPADAIDVERHEAGHSNETLFVEWGSRDLVLRRPPPGETAETAHDVLREYRVQEALQGTPVPVPRTVLACEDESVIGSEFYLMEREAGDVVREAEPERFATPDHRRRIGEALVDTLATVHGVDVEAVGLGEFGYPEGFTERQVDRWSGQYEWAFEVTAAEREVPAVHELTGWLREHVPETHPHTLVHGDYTLNNVMFGPGGPPELVAVFDWELSTLGDPFTDLGWLLMAWADEGDRLADLGSLAPPALTAREGYPTRRELVERYEAATGRRFENDRFYRVLAFYKLGALGEMFYRRHLEGNADDEIYPEMVDTVPAIAERALRIADGTETL